MNIYQTYLNRLTIDGNPNSPLSPKSKVLLTALTVLGGLGNIFAMYGMLNGGLLLLPLRISGFVLTPFLYTSSFGTLLFKELELYRHSNRLNCRQKMVLVSLAVVGLAVAYIGSAADFQQGWRFLFDKPDLQAGFMLFGVMTAILQVSLYTMGWEIREEGIDGIMHDRLPIHILPRR